MQNFQMLNLVVCNEASMTYKVNALYSTGI